MSQPYEAQLERAKRWKEKIEGIMDDYRNGKLSEEPVILADMINAFFIFCHHIGDYIINDTNITINDQLVYDNINNNECLKICHDICNGTKHLTLTRPKTSGGHFWVRLIANTNMKTKVKTFDVRLNSGTKDEEFSALAENCINKWEEFIEKEMK